MNYTTKISIILLCLLLSSTIYGQHSTVTKKNSVDLTLGGTGLMASLNYGRIIMEKSNYLVNASLGVGTVPFVGGMVVPHSLTVSFGKERSFLEVGVGGSFWSGEENASGTTKNISSYHLSPIVGWRRYFKNSMFFRAYASPLFRISGVAYVGDNKVLPYGGLSLGYAF